MPHFTSDAEERAFWESPKNDSTEFVDWSDAKSTAFLNLKPTTRAISLRLPEGLLNSIQIKRDVPYQSLIKLWLDEKLKKVHTEHVRAFTTKRNMGCLSRQDAAPLAWLDHPDSNSTFHL
jgi:predicted DNA binding CopG/RHH family protein